MKPLVKGMRYGVLTLLVVSMMTTAIAVLNALVIQDGEVTDAEIAACFLYWLTYFASFGLYLIFDRWKVEDMFE